MINSFIVHIGEMYGKSWEKEFRFIRVQDQSKRFVKIYA